MNPTITRKRAAATPIIIAVVLFSSVAGAEVPDTAWKQQKCIRLFAFEMKTVELFEDRLTDFSWIN